MPDPTLPKSTSDDETRSRFSPDLMYEAARLYYEDQLNQAQIAAELMVSRPTVSRLIAEAREVGIVSITVRRAASAVSALGHHVAEKLRLRRVFLAPGDEESPGRRLIPALHEALLAVGFETGDVLLISSGRTLHGCLQYEFPHLPEVIVAPTVGGQEEPQPWYQTNVMTTMLAERIGGRPLYLYAPALPSPSLRRSLLQDPSYQRVAEAWDRGKAALLGIGTAPLGRTVIPGFVPRDAVSLSKAVGDVCSRFYSASGEPVNYPGSARLVAITLESLQRLDASIGVAAGADKVAPIIAAARRGYINQLVTDVSTARALLAAP